MSIKTNVTIDNNRLLNRPDPVIAICRKQAAICLFLAAALKTVTYLRVSTRSQNLANQKLAILEFSQKRRFTGAETSIGPNSWFAFLSNPGAGQLLEHSFVRVPGQTASADSLVEHGDVRVSVGRKGIAQRLVRRPEQHLAQQR